MHRATVARAGWLLLFAAQVALGQAELRQPCDDATYAKYAALYEKPDTPAMVEVLRTTNEGGTKVDSIEFYSAKDQKVSGYLMIPPSQKKLPVLLALHGLGGSKDDFVQAAPMLAMFGVEMAILALDAQYHGTRRVEGKNVVGDPQALQAVFTQTVIDYRVAMDYLATRPELDATRVGVAGMSMGAMQGTILTALEPKIKTAMLAVGGGDWISLLRESPAPFVKAVRDANPNTDWETLRPLLDPIDPVNFASRLGKRPILLMNATNDEIIPKRCADTLHAAAVGEPLEKIWLPSGHQLPGEEVAQKLLTWCLEKL
ncbi:MAG: alpha/beta fold hydrolase [Fimbriimonadaceae bacterium]|nr:alpha/beta fold hydrolase [Fimbriimonadaceae bacterium]